MSPKTSMYLTISAMLLSTTAIVITAFRIEIVLTHDTWIGIMSSLIGAAATLIVGTQIYNSITTRKDIESIRSLQKELKGELEWCENLFKGNHHASQALALWNTQEFDALACTVRAIKYYLQCKDYSSCNVALSNAEKLAEKINKKINTVNKTGYDRNLEKVVGKIRESKEYDLIKKRFEKILEERKELIRLIDEREAKKAGKSQ